MKGFLRRRSTLFLAALLGLSLAPCRLAAETPGTGHQLQKTALSADELANIRYVRDNVVPHLPHRLNLADDRQYAYVLQSLRRAGRTAERLPHLYRLLAQAHAQGKPGKPVMVGATTGATLEGINFLTAFGISNGIYYADALSTYPTSQVPVSTEAMISLVDDTSRATLGTGYGHLYAATNLQVSASGAPTAAGDAIEAIALFIIAPSGGGPLQTFSLFTPAAPTVAPISSCQLSPNYNPDINSGPQQCGTSSATTCASSTAQLCHGITCPITVCYGNRINNECDYGCTGTSSYPPTFMFPITGSANFGVAPITTSTGSVLGSLYITLVSTTGGGCTLNATTDLSMINVNSSTNLLSWNLPSTSFPNSGCMPAALLNFNYSFDLSLESLSGDLDITFTSDPAQQSLSDTVAVPPLQVAQGCLPAGVKIRMADGSERAIETFQADGGEKVRAQGERGPQAVTGKTFGHEEKPLVRIRDDHGHTLLLTQAHPVITSRGPMIAAELKRGDVVLTESGEAALLAVDRQSSPRPVPVHNLRVGSRQQAVGAQSTFYANGILVGDQMMQLHLMEEAAKPRHLSQQEILRRLPSDWRRDFLNSLADSHP